MIDRFIKNLKKKTTAQKGMMRYLHWHGVGFQCGVCFNIIPSYIPLTICAALMRKDPPEFMRKSPSDRGVHTKNYFFLVV